MAIVRFPPIEQADKDGLLAGGGDFEVQSLLLAYTHGIFPWPLDQNFIAWFAPPKRSVLFFKDLHLSRSLKRALRKGQFSYEIDHDFRAIIEACSVSANRTGQKGTWITQELIDGYCDFHEAGFAHCVGCYNGDKLVGGVYGVGLGKYFSAESMFYTEPDASKYALWQLIQFLSCNGVMWIDTQVINPFTKSIGATEIPRPKFMKLLVEALRGEAIEKWKS